MQKEVAELARPTATQKIFFISFSVKYDFAVVWIEHSPFKALAALV